VLIGHTNGVNTVCVTSDCNYIISGSWDNTVRVWSIESGECVFILEGHANWVNSVYITSDCNYIISASLDNTVRVWSLTTGEFIDKSIDELADARILLFHLLSQ